MKNKVFALIFAVLLTFSFSGCGSSSNEGNNIDYSEFFNSVDTASKENNIVSEPENDTEAEESAEPVEEEGKNLAKDSIRPEFKEALDSYEAFFDEYCAFMKKYEKSPNDLTLLADYADYISKYADVMSKMEALDDGSLTDAELKYYIDVTGRISKKLVDVA